MAEYIEREKVLDAAKYGMIADYDVKAIPAADVVGVVRCEDCKYREECMKQIVLQERNHVLEVNIYHYTRLDFCSHGKRREANANDHETP